MNILADKIEIMELVNKLYIYTDYQWWNKLKEEVFTEKVLFDMSSAGGGEPTILTAERICNLWRDGFATLDAVHHQAGHYLITIEENEATIFAYSIATHYRKAATKGKTRTYTGSYDLHAVRNYNGWRINQFKYNLKYMDGNVTLE